MYYVMDTQRLDDMNYPRIIGGPFKTLVATARVHPDMFAKGYNGPKKLLTLNR